MNLMRLAALAALLALAGCASAPDVRVEQARPVSLAPWQPIVVSGIDQEAVWAAREALTQVGLINATAGAFPSGHLALRTYTDVSTHHQLRRRDPYCDRYGWYPPGWSVRSHWGGMWGYCLFEERNRIQRFPVRTLTWGLETADGEVVWYASAREARPTGPPLALSRKLAAAMMDWQARVNPAR